MNDWAGLLPRDDVAVGMVVAAVIILIAVARGVRIVPQGYEHTVERFGRFSRTLKPGLGLIVPFIDAIGHRLSMQEQVMDIPEQTAITRDNATVLIDAVVFYQVLDAAKAAYEVADLRLALVNLAQTNMRTVVGSLDLDEVLSRRDEINARLLTTIDEASMPWGVKLTRVEIKNLLPPADILEAMGRQLKADRERRAVILEAEGERQAAILRAEGQKQAAILQAEGRREAAFRDAEARERSAQAEAEATRVVSAALAAGSVQALNYFVARDYVGALGRFADSRNQKLLVLPLEATAVMGALAGVTELMREAGLARGGTLPTAAGADATAAGRPGRTAGADGTTSSSARSRAALRSSEGAPAFITAGAASFDAENGRPPHEGMTSARQEAGVREPPLGPWGPVVASADLASS